MLNSFGTEFENKRHTRAIKCMLKKITIAIASKLSVSFSNEAI